jgi:hypothetical protein
MDLYNYLLIPHFEQVEIEKRFYKDIETIKADLKNGILNEASIRSSASIHLKSYFDTIKRS